MGRCSSGNIKLRSWVVKSYSHARPPLLPKEFVSGLELAGCKHGADNRCNAVHRVFANRFSTSAPAFRSGLACKGSVGEARLSIFTHTGVWNGLSVLGQEVLRHSLRTAGKSVAALRADMTSQGHVAWQSLLHKGHFPSFPPLGRMVSAASLACTRSQVAPRILALILGEATWAHSNVAEAEQLHTQNPLTSQGIYHQSVILAFLFSCTEGLILILRALYLVILFTPAIVMAPFVESFDGKFRRAWLRIVLRTLEHAGAAFIKWGQWAAARPDLFPRDLCSQLAQLHTKAPAHNFAQTKRTVEGAFGRKLNEIFEDFEEDPVASGSIAQVHRAVLRFRYPGQQSKPMVVAVKVRHPGVSDVIRRDFMIINWLARAANMLPGFSWLRLDESVQQFAVFMMTQVDLAREAAHLSRFIYNFRRWSDVSFPKPLYPLVHPAVLVETYESGETVSRYVDKPGKSRVNSDLAHIGTHTLLKMLLVDNFIHADMHPGNILVRIERGKTPATKGMGRTRPHVVLLDVGMTAELSQRDRGTLLEFFKAVALKDGRRAAECTLNFSRAQHCPNPNAFKKEVEAIFKYWRTAQGDALHAGECMQELLEQVRRHRVNIDGDVCTVMVTTLVLEGWQRKLDPEMNIMDTLHNLLFKADWAASLAYTIDGLMGP